MNRRHWLQLATASLIPGHLTARESTGRWDKESMQEYSALLLTWLQEDFAKRAHNLDMQANMKFELKYEYLAPTEDRSKLRMLEKFSEQRLSSRDLEEHVTNALTELESVRKKLAVAEAIAAANWENKKRLVRQKGGTVFDQQITSGYLGVVLDNSPSMRPYIEKLREEISRDFSDAYYVEVSGCNLENKAVAPWYFAEPTTGINPFTPDRHIPAVPTYANNPWSTYIRWTRDATGALQCMSSLMKMDAVYWFCDFDDSTSDDIIKEIAREYMKNKIRLYIHTLAKRPPGLLIELAERSGGAVIRKRI